MKKVRNVKRVKSILVCIVLALCFSMVNPLDYGANSLNHVQAASKIKLNKKNATLNVGKSLTLNITGTKNTVKWTSNKKSVVSIKKLGKYKVKITAKKAGTTTITAKIGSKKLTCKIKVNIPTPPAPPAPTVVQVKSVSLNKTSLDLKVGNSYKLTTTILPSNATNKSVTWSSSNTSVAGIKNGIVTATSIGTTIITAKSGNIISTCKVTVSPIEVSSISLDYSELNLNAGEGELLYTYVLPFNATNKTVTWTSSDSTVADVNSVGLVFAKKAGTTTITAKAGNMTAICTVNVTLPIESILSFDSSNRLLTTKMVNNGKLTMNIGSGVLTTDSTDYNIYLGYYTTSSQKTWNGIEWVYETVYTPHYYSYGEVSANSYLNATYIRYNGAEFTHNDGSKVKFQFTYGNVLYEGVTDINGNFTYSIVSD